MPTIIDEFKLRLDELSTDRDDFDLSDVAPDWPDRTDIEYYFKHSNALAAIRQWAEEMEILVFIGIDMTIKHEFHNGMAQQFATGVPVVIFENFEEPTDMTHMQFVIAMLIADNPED